MQDLLPIAAEIGTILKDRKQTVAVAESSTGGLISAALLSVPGASAYYIGGAVIYTIVSRQAILEITEADLAGGRAATEEYALLMARKIGAKLATTWTIAETGATGPAGNRYGDPAGHTCIAINGPLERSITLRTGSADRVANMRAFAAAALGLFSDCLAAQKA
jgi:PncC family amidohydrolase